MHLQVRPANFPLKRKTEESLALKKNTCVTET